MPKPPYKKHQSQKSGYSQNINWDPNRNPYNFVPWDTPVKLSGQPPSLSRFQGLSGKVTCILTNETPLMIGGEQNDTVTLKEIDFFKIDSRLTIPGTSIKGMVRSVFEAITNACFAVFDEDRLDHRTPRINLKAGQITRMPVGNTDGEIVEMKRGWIAMPNKPRQIRGKQNNKVQNFVLAQVPANIKSGDEIWVKVETIGLYFNSQGRSIPGPIHLVIDISHTQQPGYKRGIYKITGQSIGNKKRERVFFETGQTYEFTTKEEEDYNYIFEQQLERWQSQGGFDFLERNKLSIGALVYFQPQGTQAKHISRVEIPRLRYAQSRKDLLPEPYHKCTDPDNLCMACQLFGFVEGDFRLSGRINFADAEHLEGPGQLEDWLDLKVLGSPHPTSFNFYLKDPNDPNKVRNYDGYEILNERGDKWGSQEPVQLRGRKFYYHHPNSDNWESYADHSSETEKLRNKIKPARPNNRFRFNVFFRNLTESELGLLLYSLGLEGNLRHKLGMAKSIGFGTVQIEIDTFNVDSNLSEKYSSWATPETGDSNNKKDYYIDKFKQEVFQAVGKSFDDLENIKKLKKILDPASAPFNIGYLQKDGYKWYIRNRNKPLALL